MRRHARDRLEAAPSSGAARNRFGIVDKHSRMQRWPGSDERRRSKFFTYAIRSGRLETADRVSAVASRDVQTGRRDRGLQAHGPSESCPPRYPRSGWVAPSRNAGRGPEAPLRAAYRRQLPRPESCLTFRLQQRARQPEKPETSSMDGSVPSRPRKRGFPLGPHQGVARGQLRRHRRRPRNRRLPPTSRPWTTSVGQHSPASIRVQHQLVRYHPCAGWPDARLADRSRLAADCLNEAGRSCAGSGPAIEPLGGFGYFSIRSASAGWTSLCGA